MKVRYYRTKLEGKNEDRFEMLANLISEEKEYDHLKPRILHLEDRKSEGGYPFLSAIVVWE